MAALDPNRVAITGESEAIDLTVVAGRTSEEVGTRGQYRVTMPNGSRLGGSATQAGAGQLCSRR